MIYTFVRQCNYSANSVNKERPSWYSKERIWQNLLKTSPQMSNDITIIFDGTPNSNHFLFNYKGKMICKHGGNDAASFRNTLDHVMTLNLKDEDIVYFLEDDYLHLPNWNIVLEEAFKYTNADYVTLYDHPDKYFYKELVPDFGYDKLKSTIFVTPHCHWRTVPSTTNTYAAKYSTLKKHISTHYKWCDPTNSPITLDHLKFLDLGNQGATLISSIPGWSAHIVTNYMSPLIDWEKVQKQTT